MIKLLSRDPKLIKKQRNSLVSTVEKDISGNLQCEDMLGLNVVGKNLRFNVTSVLIKQSRKEIWEFMLENIMSCIWTNARHILLKFGWLKIISLFSYIAVEFLVWFIMFSFYNFLEELRCFNFIFVFYICLNFTLSSLVGTRSIFTFCWLINEN